MAESPENGAPNPGVKKHAASVTPAFRLDDQFGPDRRTFGITVHKHLLLDRAVIPPSAMTGVVEIGQRAGLPAVSWFDGTGLSPADLSMSGTLEVSARQT